MPTTTISETEYTTETGDQQKQYRTTVPKGLAEALNLSGAKVEWEIDSANTLLVRKVNND